MICNSLVIPSPSPPFRCILFFQTSPCFSHHLFHETSPPLFPTFNLPARTSSVYYIANWRLISSVPTADDCIWPFPPCSPAKLELDVSVNLSPTSEIINNIHMFWGNICGWKIYKRQDLSTEDQTLCLLILSHRTNHVGKKCHPDS